MESFWRKGRSVFPTCLVGLSWNIWLSHQNGLQKILKKRLLDGVQDPGNLGTIIRTADWFGIDTIFASSTTVDVFNPKTVQSTMGSLSRVNVFYTDLTALLASHRDMPSYGTFLNGKDTYKYKTENRGFLIMGNEGNGISDEVRKLVAHPLFIPPYNPDAHGESLNVAIATAIALSNFRFG